MYVVHFVQEIPCMYRPLHGIEACMWLRATKWNLAHVCIEDWKASSHAGHAQGLIDDLWLALTIARHGESGHGCGGWL